MANSHSALAPTNFMPMVQDFLNQKLVARGICRTGFPLNSGKIVDFPYITKGYVQTYTEGTDLTIVNNTATSDTMNLNVSAASTFTLGPNQQKQAEDKGIQAKLANQQAENLKNYIDQKVLYTGTQGATATAVSGGTLTASNIFSKLTDALSNLNWEAAYGTKFAALDPKRLGLLSQSELANGFNKADSAFANGFVGDSAAGFRIYMSNNLPVTVLYTMDTINVAASTFTIAGVTFLFVANGTAANAGEISIGGNVGTNQTNFVLAINGTGTPGASTYIDVSQENRDKLKNAGISASSFATNVSTITGYGRMAASTTSTAGTNGVGTETGYILTGDIGAVSLGMQIEPTMASAPIANRPMETNYAIHTLFGTKVFHYDAPRLCNITINI